MNQFLRKLTSRKFWCALAGAATGVAMILGADQSQMQAVAGGVTSLLSLVAYILTEGRIDAVKKDGEGK